MNYLKRLFRIRRRDWLHVDYLLFFTTVAIALFGTYNIYLSTKKDFGFAFAKSQLIFLGIGIIIAIVIICMDYERVLPVIIPLFYWLTIGLLVAVLFTTSVYGAKGWFTFGGFSLQPAELAKLAILLMVSKKMQDVNGEINNFKNFMMVAAYAVLPMGLMMLQPEMGLTMVSFFIVLFIFFIMGLRFRVILGGVALLAASIVAALSLDIVPSHWKSRIYAFISKTTDELSTDFQLTAAKISIGSGQATGSTTPGYYNWIPFNSTDFIFAVVSENFGFIGAISLLLAFCILMWRLLVIAKKSHDIFGRCVGVGVFAILLFSVLQNVGMTIGLMPISGITLPFVSAGGSSLVTNFMAIAVALNVGMRRKRSKIGNRIMQAA